MRTRAKRALAVGACLLLVANSAAIAQKKYDPGASDTLIRIGQTAAYTGPYAGLLNGAIARKAYFDRLKQRGGINGRIVELITYDDGYSPVATLEQTRKLVEEHQVLLVLGGLSTLTNETVQIYLDDRRVPQVFLVAGRTRFSDPPRYPWTTEVEPILHLEPAAFAKFILRDVKAPRIAVLYPLDGMGIAAFSGFKAALGDRSEALIVREIRYDASRPSVDFSGLSEAGANVLVNFADTDAVALAIRKAHDIGWRPTHLALGGSASLSQVLLPAGVDSATGVAIATFQRQPWGAAWADEATMQDFRRFLQQYAAHVGPGDALAIDAYILGETLVQVLAKCGDELTRANVLKQAANVREAALAARVAGAPPRYSPTWKVQMMKFDGKGWARLGAAIDY